MKLNCEEVTRTHRIKYDFINFQRCQHCQFINLTLLWQCQETDTKELPCKVDY